MEARHSVSSAPLSCTHTVQGSLPSLLPATPGTQWDTKASDGAVYPENPGESEHVPQGAAALGPCSGPMVWGWMV